MDDAACKDTDDPDAFFPGRGQSDRKRKAQAMCMTCPVMQECEDFRSRMNERHGIWAGVIQRRIQD